MYIKRIKIMNYGPIKNLDMTMEFDENNNPKTIIVVGENGSGKSLLLSNIIDSLIELKKTQYSSIQEVAVDKFYKLGKKDYISYDEEFSYINLKFNTRSDEIQYTDLTTNLSNSEFTDKYSELKFEGFDLDNKIFQQNGFYKSCSNGSDILEEFNKHIYLYFPYDRYEVPAWLNGDTNIRFKYGNSLVGYSNRNIIKTNILKDIESWVLDIALDRELYEKVIAEEDGKQIFKGYNGKNNSYIIMINQMLTQIYKSKFGNIKSARIGIDPKTTRRISIFIRNQDNHEVKVAPTFSHLSTGEIMLLSLFTSIIKDYDEINNKRTIDFADVSGIVIIDEIDLHLHIAFQKDVILNLIKLFPKVQFIITTHSPFLVMGLNEILYDKFQLINLPLGNTVRVEEFNEFQYAYELFIESNNRYKHLFESLDQKIKLSKKPLIITEGKTDWKHIKNAISKLKTSAEVLIPDVDFLEYNDEIEMGDSHLKSLCEQYAKICNDRKIICIFDRDTPKILREMAGDESTGYKSWGNNVYSFCIPVPSHREGYKNISIEFYYTDDEIHTIDNGKQLLFSNEIEERATKSCTTGEYKSILKKLSTPRVDEELIKKVYCQDVDKIIDDDGNLIALSKTIFSENIYTDKEGFSNFNFSEFIKILDVINKILRLQ